jgi:hypothetical protein
MKKTTIRTAFILVVLAISLSSFGQGIYFGIGGGYGFAAGKSGVNGFNSTNYTSSFVQGPTSYTSTSTVTNVKYSFGSGVPIGLYGGYMFTKNIGAELGIGYLVGGKNTFTNNQSQTFGNATSTDNTTETLKGHMMRITPAIRIQVGEDKLQPYMTAGLIIGMAAGITDETVEVKSNAGSPVKTYDDIWTYSGGMSIGFHGALGVNYMISDKLGIFGELTGNYMNWAPSKKVLSTSTLNGADQLSQKTTDQKETDFSSSYTTTSGTPTNTGNAQVSSPVYAPFSSFGLTIGVHISLGGK